MIGDDTFKGLTDFGVGYRVSFLFNIGRIGQQSQNTVLAINGELIQIGRHVADGTVSDFEVTSVNQQTVRGVDCHTEAIDHTVADPNKIELKGAQPQFFVRKDLMQGRA